MTDPAIETPRQLTDADRKARRAAAKALKRARGEREVTLARELETLISLEMLRRGFIRREEKPGHWRSCGGYGHDLEFRHRTLVRMLRGAYAEGGKGAVLHRLRSEVDVQINRQVSP